MVKEHPDVRRRLDQQLPELGGGRSRRNGCRTATSSCASIRAAPDARPATSIRSRRARRSTSTTASNGRRVQPWSSGKIGMAGISYYAINQWQVAGLQPPHLAAICVWEGAGDWYRDKNHHGGILCAFQTNWYDMQVKTVQHGLGDNGPVSNINGDLVCGPETLSRARARENPLRLRRRDRRACARRRISPRPLGRLGQDHGAAAVRAATGAGKACTCAATSKASCAPHRSRNGSRCTATAHWTLFYTDYGNALQKRFFGHFLKGENTGWDKQPRVQLQVRHPGEKFVERHENEWPLARTQWTKFYLDPATQRSTRDPCRREARVELRRARRRPDVPDAAAGRRRRRSPGRSPPSCSCRRRPPTRTSSWSCACSTPNGKEVVFHGALDPHTPIAQGWLRASHRKLDPKLSSPTGPITPTTRNGR